MGVTDITRNAELVLDNFSRNFMRGSRKPIDLVNLPETIVKVFVDEGYGVSKDTDDLFKLFTDKDLDRAQEIGYLQVFEREDGNVVAYILDLEAELVGHKYLFSEKAIAEITKDNEVLGQVWRLESE